MLAPDYIMTQDRLEQILAKGFSWTERCSAMQDFILWQLSANSPAGKVYTNGELSAALMRSVGIRDPRSYFMRKHVSRHLTDAGKKDDVLKDWVIPGPEMETFVKGKGKVHVRTRLWKAWGEKPETPPPSSEDERKVMIAALTQLGYRVIAPGEDAIDTGAYSRYPINGQTALTCGACGGGGKVWKKS